MITKSSRTGDLVCRWGGEEFIVLLPHTSLAEATMIAERLRLGISMHLFKEADHITVSIGVTQYNEETEGVTLVSKADSCLYKAKMQGRNRVVFEC